ncbi:MAG TPA: DNA repair protein RadC [Polyangiales bacterium]|nr:DNA repair protein RadC [Polyangiales bacterium]
MEPIVDVELPGPRERLALHGRAALSDAELVALLLGTGTSTAKVSIVAARLLEYSGGLHGLTRLSIAELETQPGIGTTKASRLLAAIELGARVHARPLERSRPITSSRDVAAALSPRLVDETREHFIAIALDAKNCPLAEVLVAIGGISACSVAPADVFRPVVRVAAVSVLFVHNHPSGDPQPSEADVAITDRLRRAGALLGVQVLDHVILGRGAYFSFLDAGLMAHDAGVAAAGESP